MQVSKWRDSRTEHRNWSTRIMFTPRRFENVPHHADCHTGTAFSLISPLFVCSCGLRSLNNPRCMTTPRSSSICLLKLDITLNAKVSIKTENLSALETVSTRVGRRHNTRKVFRICTVRYNWPMSAHASQATGALYRFGRFAQYHSPGGTFRNFVPKGCNFLTSGQITRKSNRARTET